MTATQEPVEQAPADEAASIVAGAETPAEAPPEQTPAEPTPEAGGESAEDRFAALESRFSDMRSELGLAPPPTATPEEGDEPGVAGLFGATPGGEPETPEGEPEWGGETSPEDQVQEYVDQLVSQRVEETLSPFFQQERHRHGVEAARTLENKYPELENPRVAKPVMDMSRGLLHQLAIEVAGPEAGEALAQSLFQGPASVKLAEIVYLASKGEAAASSGGPANDETEVTLETPGARAPQGGSEDLTEAQKIVGAGAPEGVPGFLR